MDLHSHGQTNRQGWRTRTWRWSSESLCWIRERRQEKGLSGDVRLQHNTTVRNMLNPDKTTISSPVIMQLF